LKAIDETGFVGKELTDWLRASLNDVCSFSDILDDMVNGYSIDTPCGCTAFRRVDCSDVGGRDSRPVVRVFVWKTGNNIRAEHSRKEIQNTQ